MSNRLTDANSPYLLQHADNPVDWYPWGPEALALAERLDRPILLSIGYAACHWCHVMAHESFENEAIAETMNRLFVCVKVDREERPDLDRIYQTAHQVLTNRPGGWPLTVALTPGGHAPIFAGTYFPPEPRHGMPGFAELLERIAAHYRDNHGSMADHEAAFRRALGNLNPVAGAASSVDADAALRAALETLKQQFDPAHGGFGDAPKFPHPTQLELLLHLGAGEGERADLARAMLVKTLQRMHRGGLFDQLTGGFFRYSVDRAWRIPHFEKMLYDNAQLLGLYADAGKLTGNPEFERAAGWTADWVMSDMQQDHGGYAATLDADSEGHEGRYYVWSETDLRAVLSAPEYEALEAHFGLYGEPNFEGYWHFNIAEVETAEDVEIDQAARARDLAAALAKLRTLRAERVPPALDDKILTAWNGLMIRGMARAGRQMGNPALLESARRAADFVHAHLFVDGRLRVSFRDGRSSLAGYLDDYAFLAEGLLELLQAGWRARDFQLLSACCDALLTHFEDNENGGFFLTAHDHEALLYRPKTGADDAIPAANAAAVRVLHRLGMLLGESRYITAAERTVALFSADLARNPSVFAALLLAAAESTQDSVHVVLRGSRESLADWGAQIQKARLSTCQVFPIPRDAGDLPPALAARAAVAGSTVGYVCRGFQCSPPVATIEELLALLTQPAQSS